MMRNRTHGPLLVLALTLGVTACGGGGDPGLVALPWTQQFGTSNADVGTAIAVDAGGHVYVTGYADGAFLHKYDTRGTALWSRQYGQHDGLGAGGGLGLALDASDSVYVAGAADDAGFLSTYDAQGTLLRMQQFTIGFRTIASGVAVAPSPFGGVYVVGTSRESDTGVDNVFLRRYSAGGTVDWTQTFGTIGDDTATGVAVDALGNVFVTGSTFHNIGGGKVGADGNTDAYLRKYGPSGSLVWTQQFGTDESDKSSGVAVDSNGNAFVVGFTRGGLVGTNAGSTDVFLRKFDAGGGVQWTRQFGTSRSDEGFGVAVDIDGNAYLTGTTSGSLGGTSAGYDDVFVRAYAANGNVLWSLQFGSSGWDAGYGIAVDAGGNVYVAGSTTGDIVGDSVRPRDVFVSKLIR
jgi:hypothetical protein